jgi:hypothetical protein
MTKVTVFWIGVAMGISFAVGCGAAVLVIPPARAQTSTRYEFLRVNGGWNDAQANAAGAQGWHLVAVFPAAQYYERELP